MPRASGPLLPEFNNKGSRCPGKISVNCTALPVALAVATGTGTGTGSSGESTVPMILCISVWRLAINVTGSCASR